MEGRMPDAAKRIEALEAEVTALKEAA